jgi:hypothetical protein
MFCLRLGSIFVQELGYGNFGTEFGRRVAKVYNENAEDNVPEGNGLRQRVKTEFSQISHRKICDSA